MIGSEVVIVVKSFLNLPGTDYLLAVAGMGVAAAAIRQWLVKREYHAAAYISDRIFFLAGGFVFLDLFMTTLKRMSAVFDLF